MTLSVCIAPDSFKGTLGAGDVAAAIAEGWSRVRPGDSLTLLPQADGGEGTLDAIEAAVPRAIRHGVAGASWLELPGGVGVVELAEACGIERLGTGNPRGASTRALGELIASALDAGIGELIVALGGSASTDGGAGALSALGMRLTDAAGRPIPDGGAALALLSRCDRTRLVTPPPGGVTLLSDVDAPLLGPRGAAAVFAPQKGADADDVRALEAGLARFATVLGGEPGHPGAGAAGGTAFGLATAFGARIRSGAEYIAALTGLAAAIATADIVVTGEGQFDSQSLGGKVVGTVLGLTRTGDARLALIAGRIAVAPEPPVWSQQLATIAGSTGEAMARPAHWLRIAGANAARELGAAGALP